ncbi:conserved hypothetical protein [Ricinus communis]|uniref:Uncharacterized protein n=1 Tax=Ricinus communis TaxID=3988 RepID=B9TH33_RICCO|nr:conserved hypothetical protein [Ricinus communis]
MFFLVTVITLNGIKKLVPSSPLFITVVSDAIELIIDNCTSCQFHCLPIEPSSTCHQ